MNSWQAYISGFRTYLGYPKMWLIYYGWNLAFALLTAFPYFQYLNSQLGKSLVGSQLLQQFDFRILSDILVNYGAGIVPFLNQSFLLAIVFLVIGAFLQGGILYFYNHQKDFESGTFWAKCTRHVGKILRLTLFFLILHLIWLVVCWFCFQALSKGMSTDRLQSEATVIMAVKVVGIPYLIIAAMIGMLQDYAKTFLVKMEGHSIFRAIGKALSFCKRHFIQCFILLLMNVLTLVLLYALYKIIHVPIAPNTGFKVLVLFILAQCFIFCRIGVKLWNLASIARMVNK